MRITYLLFYLFCIAGTGFAQDKANYSAMTLALNGEGLLIRDSKTTQLTLPQRFLPNDVIDIKKGDAIIMLFSGEEITVSSGSKYTIPADKFTANNEIFEMANGNNAGKSLLSPTGVAYQLRGESRVFPIRSLILNQNHAILRISYDNVKALGLTLSITNSQTQRVIYRNESIGENQVSLSQVPFKPGQSYFWVLSHTPNGKPEMGTIVIPNKTDDQTCIKTSNLKTHSEFIQAISMYYNANYYFDTLYVLNQAINKYPDHTIYKVLRDNLLQQ